MRTYIVTSDESTQLTRTIINRGIANEDAIVFLCPKEGEQPPASDAINQTINDLGFKTTTIVEDITIETLDRAVMDCLDVLKAAKGSVEIVFGSGPNTILIALMIVALADPDSIDDVLLLREIDDKTDELPLPNITGSLPTAVEETFQAVAQSNEATSIGETVEKTGQSRSTVSRHFDRLEEFGTVETEKQGKTRYAALTTTGKLHLNSMERQ